MSKGLFFRFAVVLCAAGALGFVFSTDGRVLSLLKNTALLTAATCALSLPLGTVLALLLVRGNIPQRRIAMLLIVSLLFVPLYLQAAAWSAGFGKLGWYSLAQGSFGAPIFSGWLAAIWIHAVAALPWVVVLVAVALCWRETPLEDAARLDGSTFQVFTRVTLRRCVPALGIAALWVALTTAGEMTVTDLFSIRTFAEELYTGFAWYENRREIPGWQAAVFLACLLAGLATALLGTLTSGMQRIPARFDRPRPSGRGHWLLAIFTWAVLLVIIGVPVANLVYKAGLRVEQLDVGRVRAWSGDHFVQNVIPMPGTYRSSAIWRYKQEFGWTLSIAASVATVVLVVAVPLAAWARRSRLAALSAAVIVSFTAAFSGPLVALAIVALRSHFAGRLGRWLFDQTIFAPVLATGVRALPLGILICWVAFVTLDNRVLDAAALDGAGVVRRFVHIVVPQRTKAFALAWLVAFAVAYGDLASSILVVPPGIMTLPMRVFDQLHAGVDDRLAAICLTSLCGFVLLAALALTLLMPWMSRRSKAISHLE